MIIALSIRVLEHEIHGPKPKRKSKFDPNIRYIQGYFDLVPLSIRVVGYLFSSIRKH